MAAPSVSGATTLQTFDVTSTSAPAWAAGSQTVAGVAGSNNEAVYLTTIPNTVDRQWLEFAFSSAQDLTNKVISFCFAPNINATSFRIGLFTTSNTNHRYWTISSYTKNQGLNAIINAADTAEATDVGTFNIASVAGIRLSWIPTNTSAGSVQSGFSFGTTYVGDNNSCAAISAIILSDGQLGNLASSTTIRAFLESGTFAWNDPNYGSFAGFGNFLKLPFSVVFDTDAYLDEISAYVFTKKDISTSGRFILPRTNRSFTVTNTTTQTFTALTVIDEGTNGFNFDDTSGLANIYIGGTFSNTNNVNLRDKTWTRREISGAKGTVSGGGAITSLSLSSSATIAYKPLPTTTFAGNNEIAGTAGHYISLESADGWGDGDSIDVSSFTFGTPGTNIFRVDVGGGNTVTINVAAGSGLDSSDVTVVSGSVIVTEPSVALTAENFADDIRICTARYQTFIINSADINTSTDVITLGADNETGATFAGRTTTPATLAYLLAAPGATLPTTTPQIKNENLYYVVANSSGVVQISETEGGTAIDFTNTGTESGGYLFSLTCTTELDNELISGGSGFSASYSLPDGALIDVAAQGIAADESTATTLFHRVVEWSSTAGASIADTFSLANNPDIIYGQLIGSTITSKRGVAITVTSAPSSVSGITFDLSGNIELDANAITNSTLYAPDAYVWSVYQRYTEDGIRFIRNQFEALSIMEFDFNGVLTIDNIADGVRNSPATPLIVLGNLYTSAESIYAANSGTIRVEPFFVSDLTSAGDGSFTSEDRTQLDELYATLESSGIFSDAALANAPAGGGGGDATLANQEAILSAIADVPTTTEFNARTLPAANYFDPATTPVTAGTVADKTGYSLTQSFPANFSSLLINASGHIGRVTLVDTTTTNTDMRGTDNALLATNYTAPANASIADILEDTGTTIPEALAVIDALTNSIKAKTDQLTFTVANQVDANALTGGGGDDSATIYSYFTALSRADAFKADVSGLSTLTTADIPTAASIAGAVQNELDDDFAALADILADIPDEVAAQSAIAAMLARIIKISKARGLEPGITATQLDPSDEAPGFLTTSDDAVEQTIVKNGDGSITISSN